MHAIELDRMRVLIEGASPVQRGQLPDAVPDGRGRKTLRHEQRADETAAGGEGLTTRDIEHVLKLPHWDRCGAALNALDSTLWCIADRRLDQDTLNLK